MSGAVHARVEHPLLDFGHGRGRFRHVHGDAHHLRARFGQLDALLRRGRGIRGVGHGHRLDDDGRAAADLDGADADADRLVQLDCGHATLSDLSRSGRSYHPFCIQLPYLNGLAAALVLQ